jgi:hypothetical protein
VRLLHVATLCRPDTWKEKTRLKLTAIGALKSGKRGVDKLSKGLSNWGLAFAFNKGAMGVGCLLRGLRLRDAESGDREIGKTKISPPDKNFG